jgi:general secretion pathway protein G
MRSRGPGFTLLELMIATAVVALMLSIAVPTYLARLERVRVGRAVTDLTEIAGAVERYRTAHDFKLPLSLDALTNIPRTDPWERPYEYLNFADDDAGAKIRKDHNLHPLNSEFDLYSMGEDGESNAPLTAKASRDDVIWARDGAFIGLGEDF